MGAPRWPGKKNKLMKNTVISWKVIAAVVVASASLCVQGQPAVVYDNSSTNSFIGQFYGSNNEFGDQIKMAGISYDRTITTFKFDYYLQQLTTGNEKATLNFYANNGAGGAPGTLLYTSGSFSVGRGYNTVVADGLFVSVGSDTFTWTVSFSGMSANEQFGLLFYNPPVTGSSFDDYWEKVGGVWTLKKFSTTGGPIANFGAVVTAVPEPATIQLALLLGVGWLGRIAFRRR